MAFTETKRKGVFAMSKTLSVTVTLPPDAVEIFEGICKRYKWSKNQAFIELLRWFERVQTFSSRFKFLEDESGSILLMLDPGSEVERQFFYLAPAPRKFQTDDGETVEAFTESELDDHFLVTDFRELVTAIQSAPLGLESGENV